MGDGGRMIGTHQGWRPASASQLLPRRIHLPLQSPQIKGPRAALPSPRPTSTSRWTGALQRDRQASGFQRLPDNGAMKGIPILHQIHRACPAQGGVGRDAANPRGGELHQGPHYRARQTGHPRAGQAADYILYFKPNIPLALIEAKDNSHSVGDGMQQGLDYAATLDIPFVFSSNGDGFVFHDRTGQSPAREANLGLDAFPSPADLWARYRIWKGLDAEAEKVVLQDYFEDGSGKAPRYYQVTAVNAAIEAI